MAKRKYAKSYHCKYCGRGFHFYDSMEDHVNLMHKDKRFSFESNVNKLRSILRSGY